MEEIRNIIGDSVSDKKLVEAIMSFDYDYTKALDFVLNEPTKMTSSTSRDTKLKAKTPIEKGEFRYKIIN